MDPEDRPESGLPSSDDGEAGSRLRDVLVLDYVEETRNRTCAALAAEGIEATPVVSLEAGLDVLRSRQPDAIVVNMDTPGLDTRALCEVLHRTHPGRSFTIIVIKPSPSEADLGWAATIPDLRVIEEPVTAKKLADKDSESGSDPGD